MMIVIDNLDDIYPEETLRFCNWRRFSEIARDCIFFNAGPQKIEQPWKFFGSDTPLPKILLWFEEQTWDRDTTDRAVPHVDKILTILNPKISGRYAKRQSVFYPTNEAITEQVCRSEKKYDVIYTGFAPAGDHIRKILNVLPQFNYRWVCFGGDGRITDQNVNYLTKLTRIAESRIDVCHGLVGNGTPQTKSRYFEAAFCRSLNLMHWDQWKCIEEWFTPDVDFIYWKTEAELYDLIKDVRDNWDKYVPMVESAYQKAMAEYTTYQFIRKYVGLA